MSLQTEHLLHYSQILAIFHNHLLCMDCLVHKFCNSSAPKDQKTCFYTLVTQALHDIYTEILIGTWYDDQSYLIHRSLHGHCQKQLKSFLRKLSSIAPVWQIYCQSLAHLQPVHACPQPPPRVVTMDEAREGMLYPHNVPYVCNTKMSHKITNRRTAQGALDLVQHAPSAPNRAW